MAVGRLTKLSVEAVELPPSGKRAHLWDDRLKGFGVMVTDKGVRSYIVQYRVWGRASQSRRVTIGKHGSPWTTEKARGKAAELLEQVRCKVDPFDANKAAKEAAEQVMAQRKAQDEIAQRLAFNIIADRYIASIKTRLRTWRMIRSVLDRDLVPVLGSRPLTSIQAADIIEIINDAGERGDGAARGVYNAASGVFRFAVEKEPRYFPPSASPMRDVPPPAKSAKRQRKLSDDELGLIWRSSAGLGWPFCEIVRLLMLTGQRLREVAHITQDEIDMGNGEWLIPGSRTKNKMDMVVYLSEPALEILRGLPSIKNKKGYLFTTNGENPVSGFSRAKSRLDAIIAKEVKDTDSTAMPEWRFHDLRRAMATNCQLIGIAPEIVDRMQNHVEGAKSGTRESYQLYEYHKERRAGSEKWGKRLLTIVAKKSALNNVLQMKAAS